MTARAGRVAAAGVAGGLQRLHLGDARDGFLYVPESLPARRSPPLVVVFHGSGGDARQSLRLLLPVAEEQELLLLAPDSRGRTWDLLLGGFGPDVAYLDAALDRAFASFPLDAHRVALAGFSDGASYALSLALTNGDLVDAVVAFSPGFAAPGELHGKPRIFVSHGVADPVLPIDVTSRTLVPRLGAAGYEVTYEEYDGGHRVPDWLVRRAVGWLAGACGR